MRVSQGSIVKACGSKLRCIKGTVLTVSAVGQKDMDSFLIFRTDASIQILCDYGMLVAHAIYIHIQLLILHTGNLLFCKKHNIGSPGKGSVKRVYFHVILIPSHKINPGFRDGCKQFIDFLQFA